MAPRTLPGVGLQGFAPQGETDWNAWVDANWRILSALTQCRVLSIRATPPGSPTNGDIHVIGVSIAVRDNGAWVYIAPQTGWRIYDAETTLFHTYNGSAWVPDDADLTATSNSPALIVRKRGSAAGLLAPNAEYSTIGAFQFMGWTGSVWRVGAQILTQTQQLWSGAANGSALVFQVIANGATSMVDRLQLTASALLPAQTDNVVSFGSSTTRWLKGWFGNISLFPAASVTPTVNGEVTFQLTSNTALAVKVKGSDGTVRTGTITLS